MAGVRGACGVSERRRSQRETGPLIQKSNDAASSIHGTMCMKVRGRVFSRTTAPPMPPRMAAETTTVSRSRRRSVRKAQMEVSWPGQRATVLVALAWMGGTPMAIIAGKEMKEPPAAIAFIAPAINEAATSQR